MNTLQTVKCSVVVVLTLCASAVSARAQVPAPAAGSYVRTHFGADEGIGTVIDEITQTPDGFLWLITNGVNLTRFDGKRFYQFTTPRPRTMAVAPDGALWLGTREALIRIPPSSLSRFTVTGTTVYHPGPGKGSDILRLLFTRRGVLWVGTSDGLFRYDGKEFLHVGANAPAYELAETPEGHLLVMNNRNTRTFIELDGTSEVPHPQLGAQLGIDTREIFTVLRDRMGATWYSTSSGVLRERSGRVEKLEPYGPKGHGADFSHEDAQGTVWVAKDEGLFRATSSGLELVAAGLKMRWIFDDRDGNLWVGTNGDGLYRFTRPAVRMFTRSDGLPGEIIMTVIAAQDGTVWAGANCGGLGRFDGTRFQILNEKDGLTNSCVWSLVEDPSGGLWIGTWGGGAYRYYNGKFTQYSRPQGLRDDRVTSIVVSRDGTVWLGTRGGVTRLKDGQLRNFTTADGLAFNSILRVFEDRAGTLWVGTRGGLDRLAGDRFEHVATQPSTVLFPIAEGRDGGFYIEDDVASAVRRLDKDRVDIITELSSATAMIETPQGESWFGGNFISRVPPGGLTRPRGYDEPLDRETFSQADGLATPEVSAGHNTLALTADNRLWAATPKGLAMFELAHLPKATAKPLIYLTDITIGRNKRHVDGPIILPAGTNHVEIDFGVVELSSPEKIRLQYRLDDVDSEWLDAPEERRAIYSGIPVGTHAMHIRGSDRNGIWDREGVVFAVTQQPFFYQTWWFVASMAAFGTLLVAVTYRWRVHQIARAMSARFDERLAERTRVARELHDTLLQTVQGSKLVADHALKDSNNHTRMVRAMEQLSSWLAQATDEGRAALNSLRGATTEKNDLAEALRRAVDECGGTSTIEGLLSVRGEVREMHPIVRDEIYRIGYEAIRNACAHSTGTRFEVSLEYGHDLILRVSDNGSAIDPEIIEQGKDDHFGLRGMRERASRIDGQFAIVSSPDSGTSVTLIVPGRVAFRTA